MVLDCIASGCAWVDMTATGVDVLISAPQKGWSATPCAGLVMLSERAVARMGETTSDSFAVRSQEVARRSWRPTRMAAMPITRPCRPMGCAPSATRWSRRGTTASTRLKEAQWALGDAVRAMLADKGVRSVAAEGFGAPGVVVSYTDDPEIQSGRAFAAQGHADRRRRAAAM